MNSLHLLSKVIFTLIFGDYVVKSITGKKTAKTVKVAATEENTEVPIIKHHKKRHNLITIQAKKPVKSTVAADSIKKGVVKITLPSKIKSTPLPVRKKTVPVKLTAMLTKVRDDDE